jgi:hypothetical protein
MKKMNPALVTAHSWTSLRKFTFLRTFFGKEVRYE